MLDIKEVLKHRSFLLNVAKTFTGNKEDGEDIVQDVMLYLLTKKNPPKDSRYLKTYLYNTVKFKFLNSVNSLYGKSISVPLEEIYDCKGFSIDPVDLNEEILQELTVELNKLPNIHKQVIRLKLEDYDNIEIIEKLNIPPGSITNYTNRKRKQGRELYKTILKITRSN